MSNSSPHTVGSIGWVDVTVENPERLRDFYRAVVGWDAGEVPMGGYADFTMHPPRSTQPVAGICHARGGNYEPARWPAAVRSGRDRSSVTGVVRLRQGSCDVRRARTGANWS